LVTNYRKIITIVTIEKRIVRIKGVRNRAAHLDFRWQRSPRKYCGSHADTTQAVSIESVSLRRLAVGEARGRSPIGSNRSNRLRAGPERKWGGGQMPSRGPPCSGIS